MTEDFRDDPMFAMRDIALQHCERRTIGDLTPQRVGPNTGSFADKRLCDTEDGQALLRAMVMGGTA